MAAASFHIEVLMGDDVLALAGKVPSIYYTISHSF